MNEEALNTMYELAKREGYTDSIDDFKALLSSNQEAFSTMYSLAQKEGYKDSEDDFSNLLGLKKKQFTQPSTTTLQPTGDTTPQQQEVSQQDTQQPVFEVEYGTTGFKQQTGLSATEQKNKVVTPFGEATSDIFAVEGLRKEIEDEQQTKKITEQTVEFGTTGFKQGVGLQAVPKKEKSVVLSDGTTVTIPTDATYEEARQLATKQAAPTINKRSQEIVGQDVIDEQTGEVNAPLAQYITKVGTQELKDNLEFEQKKINEIVENSNRLTSSLKSGSLNIVGGLTAMVDPQAAQDILEESQRYKIAAARDAGLTDDEINNGIVGNLSEGNISAGLTNLYLEAFSQAPQMAIIYGTGGTAGLGILGASAAGAEYARLYDRVDISLGEKILRSTLIGASEIITERLGAGDINMVRNMLGKESLKNVGVDVLKNIKSPFAKQFLEEGGEEFIAGFTEQLINKIADGESFNVNELIDQALIGGVSVTPQTSLAYIVSKGQYARHLSENEELFKLGKEELNRVDEALKTDGITQEERVVLEDRKKRMQGNLLKKSGEELDTYLTFSEQDLNSIYDINKEVANLEAKRETSLTAIAKEEIQQQINSKLSEKQAIEQKYSNQEVTNQEVTAKPPAQETPTETPATTTTSEENVSQKSATLATESLLDNEKIISKNPENFGYHGGTLEGKSDYLTIGYTGEQPFTGHYFFSDKSRAETRGDRSKEKDKNIRAVDFTKYNLLRPTTNGYWALKSGLKQILNNISSGKQIDQQIERIKYFVPEVGIWLESNKENIKSIYEEWKAIRDENFKTRDFEKSRTERFETYLLKKMGYEGIDVRGLKESNGEASPDSSTEGSVIFDLKEGTVYDLTPKTNDTQAQQQVRGTQQQGKQDVGKPQQQKASDETTRSDRDKQEATEKEVGKTDFLSSLEKGTDSALAWLEEQEKQLDKFGKETLGMNLPVAVAKIAVQAAKVAVKAGKTGLEVIRDVKNAVKKTSWYRNQKIKDQRSALAEVDKIFGTSRQAKPKILGESVKKFEITLRQWYTDRQQAAKGAMKEQRKFAKAVSDALKELPKGLKLSSAQTNALIRKAGKVVADNKQSIDNFIEYATKVFNDAEYAKNVNIAKSRQKQVAKNIKNGGIPDSDGSVREISLQDPELLSPEELDIYIDYLDKYGQRTRVLDRTNIIEDTNEIKQMFDDRWKKKKEQTEKQAKEESEEEDFDNNTILYVASKIDQTQFGVNFETAEFVKNLTNEQLDNLSNTEKKQLFIELNNAFAAQEQGVHDNAFNSRFEEIRRKILSHEKAKAVNESISNSRGVRTLLRDKLTAWMFGRTKEEQAKRFIRKNPLHDIGRAFYEKGRKLYDSIVLEISEQQSLFEKKIKDLDTLLDGAKLPKKAKERAKSNARMMLIALHQQYLSNPDSQEYTMSADQAVQAAEQYSKTGDGANKRGGVSYREHYDIVKEVYDELTTDGLFDIDKAMNSLSEQEKTYMKLGSEKLKEARDMEMFNARVHGTDFFGFADYIPHMVVGQSEISLEEAIRQANNALSVSTESEHHISRTKGAKPIMFDFENAVKRSYKRAALDFHMTTPLKTTSGALAIVSKGAEDQFTRDMASAIKSVIEEITQNTFANNMMTSYTAFDKAVNLVRKRGYQLALSSIPRATIEMLSNATHAIIYRPKDFIKGIGSVINSDLGNVVFAEAAKNMKSVHLDRMFGFGMVSNMIEEGAVDKLSTNAWGKMVDKVSEKLISTPDKMIAIPLWVGSVESSFKSETGEDINWKKIADGEKAYMNKYDKQIQNAKKSADQIIVEAVASTNPFEGIAANQISAKDTGLRNLAKTYNNFFTRFLIFEYTSAAKAIDGLVGRGDLTRRQGGALLAATATRMIVYQYLVSNVSALFTQFIFAAFGGEDDDEIEEVISEIDPTTEKGQKHLIRSGISFAIAMASRRLGNIGRAPINLASEWINAKYGHELGFREEETYKYGDEVAYTIYPIDKSVGRPKTTKEKAFEAVLAGTAHFQMPLKEVVNVVDNGLRMQETINEYNDDKNVTSKEEKEYQDKLSKQYDSFIKSAVVIGGASFGLPFANDIKDLSSELVAQNYREQRKKQEETHRSGGKKKSKSKKTYQ